MWRRASSSLLPPELSRPLLQADGSIEKAATLLLRSSGSTSTVDSRPPPASGPVVTSAPVPVVTQPAPAPVPAVTPPSAATASSRQTTTAPVAEAELSPEVTELTAMGFGVEIAREAVRQCGDVQVRRPRQLRSFARLSCVSELRAHLHLGLPALACATHGVAGTMVHRGVASPQRASSRCQSPPLSRPPVRPRTSDRPSSLELGCPAAHSGERRRVAARDANSTAACGCDATRIHWASCGPHRE